MRPPSPDTGTPRAAADLAACRALLAEGSRTFFAAAHVLPRRVRDRATALYAFCRVADDAVDLADDAAAVEHLRSRLDRIYSGRPAALAADRAFADVVARCAIPRVLPEALLEGFAWDRARRRYESLDALCDYAARVAGTVGAMMALVMERREPAVLARACDLGVAMQLTNIARDVGEDARAGRLYLPRDWLREAGIDPGAWLAQPAFTPALGAAVQRLLDFADTLYVRAAGGIAALPVACRPGMHAARLLYAEIGRAVERQGLDSVARRAVVPGRRKAQLVAAAVLAAASPARRDDVPPLAATRFLVDAAAVPHAAGAVAPRRFADRLVGAIELFERLERRDQFARARG
jgi:phytoene synthase